MFPNLVAMGPGRLPNGVYWIKTPVELRAFVNILKKFRGCATALITLCINSGRPIPDGLLRSEWATATNIKDTAPSRRIARPRAPPPCGDPPLPGRSMRG
jgi:hypothetical protein